MMEGEAWRKEPASEGTQGKDTVRLILNSYFSQRGKGLRKTHMSTKLRKLVNIPRIIGAGLSQLGQANTNMK